MAKSVESTLVCFTVILSHSHLTITQVNIIQHNGIQAGSAIIDALGKGHPIILSEKYHNGIGIVHLVLSN